MQIHEQWKQALRQWGFAPPEDPDVLLEEAQTELREAQARNRARAVEAITAKNNLQQQVNDMRRRVDNLGKKADDADAQGETKQAQQLRAEADSYQTALLAMEKQLAQAEAMTEQVKIASLRHDEATRKRLAEILALRTQWKASTIQKRLVQDMADLADTPANRRRARAQAKRRHHLALDARAREHEFEGWLASAEATVLELHTQIRRARDNDDENREHQLLRVLEQEEAAFVVIRDAHARARDVRERAERWALTSGSVISDGDKSQTVVDTIFWWAVAVWLFVLLVLLFAWLFGKPPLPEGL